MTNKAYHQAIAFISDIHGNVEALDAVLKDIEQQDVDGIYCLGDIVGYGPSPKECLSRLIQLEKDGRLITSVCGNHDHGIIAGSYPHFSKAASTSLEWTKQQIEGSEEWDFLKKVCELPMIHKMGRYYLTHSTVKPAPQHWAYLKIKNAKDNFIENKILFNAHTHVPSLFSKYSAGKEWNPINLFGNDGFYYYPKAEKKNLEPGESIIQYRVNLPGATPTVIVNIGSVGQPRDNVPCARYVVYRSLGLKNFIEYRQVGYPLKDTVMKLHERGLVCERELATRIVTGGETSFFQTTVPDWFPFE